MFFIYYILIAVVLSIYFDTTFWITIQFSFFSVPALKFTFKETFEKQALFLSRTAFDFCFIGLKKTTTLNYDKGHKNKT